MANVTMRQASTAMDGFYVPQFKLVANQKADPTTRNGVIPEAVLHDIVEVTYKDKLEEIDSAELVVNNWDATNNCFKYIGSETLNSDGFPVGGGANAQNWTMFDPCNRQIELFLGYAPNRLQSMMIGNFVTYEPSFTSSGPPTMSVRMLNLMHALRRKRHDQSYTSKDANPLTDTKIAQKIANEADPEVKNKKRFPIPIKKYDGPEAPLTYVIQKNQYDIDFLWQRARMNGYELRIDQDGELVYQPSTDKNAPVYELKWGQSLIDFKPTLTIGNQWKSLTVRVFDRKTQKLTEVKRDIDSPDIKKLNKDLMYLLRACDPREELIVDQPFYSQKEADEYCAGVFRDQLKRMVKATGTTVGLPGLRAGSKVYIGGLGTRLSGNYFVTATTHTLNSNGYTTRFEARREDEKDGK